MYIYIYIEREREREREKEREITCHEYTSAIRTLVRNKLSVVTA